MVITVDVAALMALHLHQTRRDRILRGQARPVLVNQLGRPPISKISEKPSGN